MHDVAIIGGGIAGMATAARLQAEGRSTVVFEAHCHPGGCAGYYRRQGFSFDVGATTLVDFETGGVGGELFESIGMPPVRREQLPGYMAWLPDRKVTLYRDSALWSNERLRVFGDTPAHRRFWSLVDRIADVFWNASRLGIRMPIRSFADVAHALRCLGITSIPLSRYLSWSMGDALRAHDLRADRALVGLLGMLIEDTVHTTVDAAPFINSALGVTIRGAGLSRAAGGMWGFWRAFTSHYRALGGHLYLRCSVSRISGSEGEYSIETQRGRFFARQVVSALPIELTAKLAPPNVARALRRYLERDLNARGGAVVVFLGVPEEEVSEHDFTHHQLLCDYSAPLGDGNNMFVSVSSAGDIESAPAGYRTVMISTHCALESWEGIPAAEYEPYKAGYAARLIDFARRVYPRLAVNEKICEVGTPRTYERFTRRPRGAVGGVRQTAANSNQRAVPHEIGVPGFWLAGDTTWPGLGTVACVLGSRIVAEGVLGRARRLAKKGGRRFQWQREAINAFVTSQ